MRYRTVLLPLLMATSSLVARAQAAPIKNAPFTATWTRVTKTPADAFPGFVPRMMIDDPPLPPGVRVAGQTAPAGPSPRLMRSVPYTGDDVRREKIEVARASDGSLYVMTTTDDKVSSIVIYDVPHGRVIEAKMNELTITTRPVTALSIPEQHEMLENKQKASDEITQALVKHMTPLGEKTEKGMTLFGLKANFKKSDGTTAEEEVWTSDTGLTTLSTHTDSRKCSITQKLVSFHVGEPNAKLFQVPKKLPSELNAPLGGPFGSWGPPTPTPFF